jgi:alpha-1,6-mannosyltransferase
LVRRFTRDREPANRTLSDLLLALLVPVTILIHLFAAPYTKVEESFNIQAVYDITAYGIPSPRNGSHIIAHYDHVEFPGAVPRTFVGALILSLLSSPLITLVPSAIGSQILGL